MFAVVVHAAVSVQLIAKLQCSYARVKTSGAGAPVALPSGRPHLLSSSKAGSQIQL